MIVDSFLFGWELEMLECRLYEMDSFVDCFVLVESTQTFQGESKPLVFIENKQRFKKYMDKIIFIRADIPPTDNPWVREYASREAVRVALSVFDSDTIVIHGDVDEIVPKTVGHQLESLIDDSNIFVMDQTFYSMAVDWLYPFRWRGSVIARKSVIDGMSMVDVRNSRISSVPIIGGWHFSWLGGSEIIKKKASSFSHTEDSVQSYILEMGERLYTEGYHVLQEKLLPVEVDENYPNYIKERKCPPEWFRPR